MFIECMLRKRSILIRQTLMYRYCFSNMLMARQTKDQAEIIPFTSLLIKVKILYTVQYYKMPNNVLVIPCIIDLTRSMKAHRVCMQRRIDIHSPSRRNEYLPECYLDYFCPSK